MTEKKPSKYKNKKVIAYGRTFDSYIELEFYRYLYSLHGMENVIVQPKFVLQPSFKKNGKSYQAISYSADFQIEDTVFDVKGMETQQFVLRKKMFDFKYPQLTLKLVTKSPIYLRHKYGEWIELDDLKSERKIRKAANK